ncbi:MAG: hypothetical protein GWM98_00620 [Nitrospinaceae bacterium]|nr:hypothetical protein [Nitrospinaceae bacterium]NIT80482.1 hypothetical protein [Nitrospinaceae bacterium]NIU94881.1 hypothetical protein [Nitrospinaceae bacterium]NIY13483.1 hypothetical protein [Nitrospinaceae bacterium]
MKFLEALWMTGNGVHRKNREALEHFLRHHFHLPDLDSVPADQVGAIAGAIKKIAAGPDASPRS